MYPTDQPCDVCGEVKNNGFESWWCYTVCEDHKHVPPAYIHEMREEYERRG